MSARAFAGEWLSDLELRKLDAALRYVARASGAPAAASALAPLEDPTPPAAWRGPADPLLLVQTTLALIFVDALEWDVAEALIADVAGVSAADLAAPDPAALAAAARAATATATAEGGRADALAALVLTAAAALIGARGRLLDAEATLTAAEALLAGQAGQDDIRLEWLLRRIELCFDLGAPARAFALLEEGTALVRASIDEGPAVRRQVGLLQAEALTRLGRFSDAKHVLEGLAAEGVAVARRRLLHLLAYLNRLDEAEALLEEIDPADPTAPAYRSLLARQARFALPSRPAAADLLRGPASLTADPPPADLARRIAHTAAAVRDLVRPQSARFRAEVQRGCDAVKALAQSGRHEQAEMLLDVLNRLAAPSGSGLLEGYLAAARAALALARDPPEALTARAAAQRAAKSFDNAGELTEVVHALELTVQLNRIIDGDDGGRSNDAERLAEQQHRLHAGLDRADRESLALTDWTRADRQAEAALAAAAAEAGPHAPPKTRRRARTRAAQALASVAPGLASPLSPWALPLDGAVALWRALPDRVVLMLGRREGWREIPIETTTSRQQVVRLIATALKELSQAFGRRGARSWPETRRLAAALGAAELANALKSARPPIHHLYVHGVGVLGQVPFPALPIGAPARTVVADGAAEGDKRPPLLLELAAVTAAARPHWRAPKFRRRARPRRFCGIAVRDGFDEATSPLAEAPAIVAEALETLAPAGAPRVLSPNVAMQDASAALGWADSAFVFCHGSSGGAPGASGLQLSDGWLGPDRIAALDLAGLRYAVIACCWGHSGRSSETIEEASVSDAFLHAGAEAVVASLWEQPVDHAAPFFRDLLGALRPDFEPPDAPPVAESAPPPSEALAYAQRAAAEDLPPAAWAGFIVAVPGVPPARGARGLALRILCRLCVAD